jgi:hypothetical protein
MGCAVSNCRSSTLGADQMRCNSASRALRTFGQGREVYKWVGSLCIVGLWRCSNCVHMCVGLFSV